MNAPARLAAAFFRCSGVLLAFGCGAAPAPEPSPGSTFIDRRDGELPVSVAELGLYPALAQLDRVHPRAVEYRPTYELWSSGSQKQRYLVLPPGTAVDTTETDTWRFPDGTLFFKTFFYETSDGAAFPVETRVLHRRGGAFTYGTYVWDETGSSATLSDGSRRVSVPVEADGQRFTHVVPSALDCRTCHESQDSPVIGFDELRLNAPLAGAMATQLEVLAARSVLTKLPENPSRIDHPDALTRSVLGYLEGNCTHCHNGGKTASAAFDMRYPNALENLNGKEADGEAISGVRVVPGDPQSSLLYQVLTRDETLDDVQPMPPLGVDRVDRAALETIERWISSLNPENSHWAVGR